MTSGRKTPIDVDLRGFLASHVPSLSFPFKFGNKHRMEASMDLVVVNFTPIKFMKRTIYGVDNEPQVKENTLTKIILFELKL